MCVCIFMYLKSYHNPLPPCERQQKSAPHKQSKGDLERFRIQIEQKERCKWDWAGLADAVCVILCSGLWACAAATLNIKELQIKAGYRGQIGLNPAAVVVYLMLWQVCGFNEVVGLSNKLMNKRTSKITIEECKLNDILDMLLPCLWHDKCWVLPCSDV